MKLWGSHLTNHSTKANCGFEYNFRFVRKNAPLPLGCVLSMLRRKTLSLAKGPLYYRQVLLQNLFSLDIKYKTQSLDLNWLRIRKLTFDKGEGFFIFALDSKWQLRRQLLWDTFLWLSISIFDITTTVRLFLKASSIKIGEDSYPVNLPCDVWYDKIIQRC